jgi:ATP-binding cassette, subfamily B, multidrug efflux pump
MEKNLFANLIAVLRHYRIRFVKAFFMVLVSNCLLILNPLVFRQAVMELDAHAGKPSGFIYDMMKWLLGSHITSLGLWALILFIISIVSSYFKYQMRFAFISVSRDAERDIRSKLFVRIQSQSMAFFDRHGIGELLSRLTNDISAYRDVLGPGIMYPLFFTTIIIPGIIALFTISSSLAAIALCPLLVLPFVNIALRLKIYRVSYSVQKGLADLSNMVQEQYSGIRIVKSYVVEHFLSQRFNNICRTLMRMIFKFSCYQGLLFPFFTMLTKMITVVLVIFSGVIILKAWSTLSVADFVSFMWIQSYIFMPVLMLAWILPVYERGRAAYDRLVEVYEEPIEVKEGKYSDLKFPPQAGIEFRHLTFRYPTSQQAVLEDLNLRIEGGTFVGITGPVAAGKTTLFRLLNRDYEISPGMIFIGERDIHDYPLKAFRQEMAIVEQTPFFFSQSIANNVRFGRETATQEELEVVAKYADLHDTVLSFPEQYETVIGERGVTLSGGQKQRLALARAFLVDRSIFLLDDVFSAVDATTERRIFSAMQSTFQKKTVILITHRVSILEKMDRVIYMTQGEVVEDGTPSQLRSLKGHYSALVELQRWDQNETL